MRALILAAIAACLATSATAQTRIACADRTVTVERLAERYGETLQSMGLHQNKGLLEVYASDETGTWSILVSSPDGRTCLIAAGEMWEPNAAPLGKPGKDL